LPEPPKGFQKKTTQRWSCPSPTVASKFLLKVRGHAHIVITAMNGLVRFSDKRPPSSYRLAALELKALIEMKLPTYEEQMARAKLRKKLRQNFMQSFRLLDDRLRVGARFFGKLQYSPLDITYCSSSLIDHAEFFRHGDNFILVSQTYGLPSGQSCLEAWGADQKISVTVAPEWGFYYPGSAHLFMLEFTPEDKKRFEKRLAADRN
jgi:hypothetical protein